MPIKIMRFTVALLRGEVTVYCSQLDPKLKDLCPHAFVAADGTFQLTTFKTDEGAPPGTYDVTVKWPGAPKPGHEEGADRLGGRYSSPERPARQVQITDGVNDLGRLDLK
jgi:hypothetical protein